MTFAGQIVDFPSNGAGASGYLALPEGGSGPGLIVVQEWWGLDSGIKEMADRLAAEGFVALAPDLYHGDLAEHTEMDKASELMQAMPPDRAARDMSGAVDFLADHDATTGDAIGVVGFCMGGMLSFVLAALRPDKIKAVVPFYGFPQGDGQPDYSKITAAIRATWPRHDDFFGPDAARELEAKLQALGKDVDAHGAPGHGPRVHGAAQRARHAGRRGLRPHLAGGRRVPARATRLSRAPMTRDSTRCSSTRAACSCCPIRRCSARSSPTTAAIGSIDAHRRAHYAAMAAKSTAGAVEADWIIYDEAYVRAVGVDEARRGGSDRRCSA